MKYGSASHREALFLLQVIFIVNNVQQQQPHRKKKKLYIDLNVILIRVSGIGFVPFHIRLYEVHVHTYIFFVVFSFSCCYYLNFARLFRSYRITKRSCRHFRCFHFAIKIELVCGKTVMGLLPSYAWKCQNPFILICFDGHKCTAISKTQSFRLFSVLSTEDGN